MAIRELLQFIESSDLGRLLSVRLVLPPDRSQSSDWVFLPVCRVERERKPLHSGLPNVVLTTDHGVRYGGHPIGLMGSDNLDRTLVIDLSADAV